MIDYAKRLVEVDEIWNYLSEDDLQKIPEKIRNVIKENKDKNYIWKYDEKRKLKDQDVNEDTIAILSYLNMEYLLNDEQKELMKKIHEYNEKQNLKENNIINNKKVVKTQIDDIDGSKTNTVINKNERNNIKDKEIVVHKNNVFTKIWILIKMFFKKEK